MLLHVGFNLTAAVNYLTTLDENVYNTLYGSKWLILLYGIIGTAVSFVLAGVYTGKLDLRRLKLYLPGNVK